MIDKAVSQDEIDRFYEELKRDVESGGYFLNRDVVFTKDLVNGLLTNVKRYGYQACPCRLASGIKKDDLDIICPCDYRDADIGEFDTCYCGLYVGQEVIEGKKQIGAIPDRRPPMKERKETIDTKREAIINSLPYPVWRCKVCGYLCAREEAPEVCPICKAKKERFERFI